MLQATTLFAPEVNEWIDTYKKKLQDRALIRGATAAGVNPNQSFLLTHPTLYHEIQGFGVPKKKYAVGMPVLNTPEASAFDEKAFETELKKFVDGIPTYFQTPIFQHMEAGNFRWLRLFLEDHKVKDATFGQLLKALGSSKEKIGSQVTAFLQDGYDKGVKKHGQLIKAMHLLGLLSYDDDDDDANDIIRTNELQVMPLLLTTYLDTAKNKKVNQLLAEMLADMTRADNEIRSTTVTASQKRYELPEYALFYITLQEAIQEDKPFHAVVTQLCKVDFGTSPPPLTKDTSKSDKGSGHAKDHTLERTIGACFIAIGISAILLVARRYSPPTPKRRKRSNKSLR